jgi:peptidylprolyl isomerase
MVGVGAVIRGWDEALLLMTEGAKFKLHVPAALAYGNRKMGIIPANADLNFVLELIKVTPGDRLPEFGKPDPEKLTTTESGLKYQILKEGEGEPATAAQGVKLKFVLWNDAGQVITCTHASKMHIAGQRDEANLPRVPPEFRPKFLGEAATLMKPGATAVFEVPPALCWGGQAIGPALPPNSVTIWHLEMLEVFDAPKFALTPAEKLTKTASGLGYEVIREGTGEQPGPKSEVKVYYTGWTPDGKMFDSAHMRREPIVFPLNRVIPGWTEGLQLMKAGAVYRFTIPGDLAYGDNPTKPGAPAGTLIFLVELIEVVKK